MSNMPDSNSHLLESLKAVLHEIHTLSVIVQDFNPSSQTVLLDKLNAYVKLLQQVKEHANEVAGIPLPLEMLK